MEKKLYSNHGKFQNNDQKPQRNRKRRKHRRKLSTFQAILVGLGIVVLMTVLGVGGFLLHNESAEKDFQKMAAQSKVAATAPTAAPDAQDAPEETTEPTLPMHPEVAAMLAARGLNREILPQYKELYEKNNELFGWLTIEGTKIDYPVMYTPGESEKYLHAAFDGSYSYPGTPFIDINCYPDSQNLMIYAHNMPNGSMFRGLLKFEEKTYWQKHPTITFNTIYEENEYEIVAAFYDRLYLETETDVFKFYYFIDPETEEEFNYGIDQIRSKALYDTGVEVSYGDKLITLVTCAYHTTHGRFVVLARQMQPQQPAA